MPKTEAQACLWKSGLICSVHSAVYEFNVQVAVHGSQGFCKRQDPGCVTVSKFDVP